jgi:hypothetical protein
MGAPAHSVLGVIAKRQMPDKFKSYFVFSSNNSIGIFQTDVQHAGAETGEKINMTWMGNDTYRTFASPVLLTLTDPAFSAGIDANDIPAILALLGKNQAITEWYPNGASRDFYGFLSKAHDTKKKEANKPEYEFEIVITNLDNGNPPTQQNPVFNTASGTT